MPPENFSAEKNREPELVETESPLAESEQRLVATGSPPAESEQRPVETGQPDFQGRFKLIESLGQGGMGTVYKVFDPELNKQFAVKVLRKELSEDLQAVRRFEQEIKAASDLNHVNLVPVYGHGRTRDGLPYLVMDYVQGQTLAELLKEGPLASERALGIFAQTCHALSHAHAKGVIHRDLKPSNIMLSKTESGSDSVLVLDFGIAKILPSEGTGVTKTSLTQTGDVFGSPLYMSPEQCENNPQDARSDIYSLGCVMYEALTGVQPFASENPVKVILKHINVEPEPVSKYLPSSSASKDLDTIVLKCLEKAPADRYQSVDALLRDLQSVAEGKAISTKKAAKNTRQQTRLSRPIKFAIAGALAVLLGVSTAIVWEFSQFSRVFAPATSPSQAFGDESDLDQKAFNHFNKGEYEKSAALLEFGVAAYRERIEADTKNKDGHRLIADETLLAENLQHIGKCYLYAAKAAEAKGNTAKSQAMYDKAIDWFQQSYVIWKKYNTNLSRTMAPEFAREYGEVLQKLGKQDEFEALREWAKSVGITM